jgi:hypothetical protein
MAEFERQSRRTFLQRLGKTLAVGVGVALLPTASAMAKADGFARPDGLIMCCPNPSICGLCTPGHVAMYCSQSNCCACLPFETCQTYSLPPC